MEKDGVIGSGGAVKLGIATIRAEPGVGEASGARDRWWEGTDGARPKDEVAAQGPCVKTAAEEEREMVCVLLSRGLRSSVRTSEDGEERDGVVRAVGTRMPKPVAQLTSGISGERSESAACRG